MSRLVPNNTTAYILFSALNCNEQALKNFYEAMQQQEKSQRNVTETLHQQNKHMHQAIQHQTPTAQQHTHEAPAQRTSRRR